MITTCPEDAGRVFIDGKHRTACGGRLDTKVDTTEGRSCGIEAIKTGTACTDPDNAVAVDVQPPDNIACDTVGVVGIMAVGDDVAGFAMEFRQATAISRQPKVTRIIFGDVKDEIVTQRIRIAAFTLEITEFVSIEAVQAVFGTEPHHPVGVLPYGQHVALRQTLIERQVLKSHRVTLGCCSCGGNAAEAKQRDGDESHNSGDSQIRGAGPQTYVLCVVPHAHSP